MSEHIVENNPKKEFLFALGGVGLFLAIVLLIGISGFLRPAGEHITVQTAEEIAAAEEAEAMAAEAAKPAATAETTAPAEAATTDTPADATVTPAPAPAPADATAAADANSAVVTAEAGTATASGTVSQPAVADAELPAEQADGGSDAGNTEKAVPAQ